MIFRRQFFLVFLSIFLVTIASFAISIEKPQQSPPDLWVLLAKKRCANLQKEQAEKCFRIALREITKTEGVEAAVQTFSTLRENEVVDSRFDDHLLVHEIGRAAAEFFDTSAETFLSCPTTFNYGCQHGFFEFALSQADSPKEAAEKICENIPTDRPPKLYYYCYHGVGHGLMMALAYNLQSSLDVCNKLPNDRAVEACWQGVLMENSNVAVTEKEQVFGFTKDDPLSPCNKLEKKYQWQCFINHGGYLSKITNLNISEAARICLQAGTGVSPCVQSLGLMTTNPLWQKAILGADNTVSDFQKNAEAAWRLCQMMPEEAHKDCVIGAVGNIHNFDETQTKRSEFFCLLVSPQLYSVCFREIGKNVGSQSSHQSEAAAACNKLVQEARSSCLTGVTGLTKKEEELLLNDDQFLRKLVKEQKSAAVVEKLSLVAPLNNLSCHDRAHEVGRFAYEIFGAEAFKSCSSLCHSGCYHGAAEAFFKDKGTENLEGNIKIICQAEKNRFFSHQCLHGIGHGLAAWANYEILGALEICDRLSTKEAQSSCWTGVFMENIVGGLAINGAGKNFSQERHYTKYLSSDPHYPCNAVAEKYKGACYFLQSSRMLQLFAGDFEKIAKECTRAPLEYQHDCFQSMGRDVGGTTKPAVKLAVEKCQFAPKGEARAECLSGAVQDFFWDPSGRDGAIAFCSQLTDKAELKRCWETTTTRASEVLNDEDYKSFCHIIPRKIVTCSPQEASMTDETKQTLTQQVVSQTAAGTDNTIVLIRDEGFMPQKIKVKKGTAVTFKNEGENLHWPASNIHPTHRIYPEFDPQKPLKSGESWSFKFDKTGIWQFHDHLYPELGGSVEVVQ